MVYIVRLRSKTPAKCGYPGELGKSHSHETSEPSETERLIETGKEGVFERGEIFVSLTPSGTYIYY
jgi:hypothetical protein